jgi:hypothetical protein
MNLNLHIETLNRAKAAVDDAIAAFEHLRKLRQKREAAVGTENLINEREAVVQAIAQVENLARTLHAVPSRSPQGKKVRPLRKGGSRHA